MEPNEKIQIEEVVKENGGFGKAVCSLICGTVSFILFFSIILSPPFAIAAIIFGVIARKEMQNITKPKGKLLASFGICLGILALVLVIMQLIAYIQHAGE